MKQQLHILQFIRSARLFQLSPSSRSRHRFCWRTATSTHFWSSTIYRYTTFHREATLKTALELLDYSVMIRRQVQKITRVFSLEIKSKRAELWTDFWQLINIFEPPGQNELIVWKTDSHFFFSCLTCFMGVWSSHPSRAWLLCHAFRFLYWFWEKNWLVCSLQFLGETVDTFLTDVERGWRCRVI